MLPLSSSSDIIIPKSWPTNIKSRVLHVISLAHYAITYARGWAANSMIARVRLQAKLNTALEEIAKLREELRIKDARMASQITLCLAADSDSWPAGHSTCAACQGLGW